MELQHDDRIAAIAAEERGGKNENREKVSYAGFLKFLQDAHGLPTRPLGVSDTKTCSVLHIEVGDRPRMQLETRFSVLPIDNL